MPATIEQLTSLIDELLQEPPANECADEGRCCALCYREHRYSRIDGYRVVHTPDCWLVRAATLTGRPVPAYAAKDAK